MAFLQTLSGTFTLAYLLFLTHSTPFSVSKLLYWLSPIYGKFSFLNSTSAIWNYAQRAIKDGLPFDPVIPLLGLYPKENIGKTTCIKIFTAALFVVAKNWKMRERPSIGEWLNKLWYLLVMEYYCAQRNNELEELHVNWSDLQELMQSEGSRTRRTLYTETDTLWYN